MTFMLEPQTQRALIKLERVERERKAQNRSLAELAMTTATSEQPRVRMRAFIPRIAGALGLF